MPVLSSSLLAFALLGASSDAAAAVRSDSEMYEALVRELEQANQAYIRLAREGGRDRARLEALHEARNPQRFVARFRDLARQASDDAIAVAALVWISGHGDRASCDEAREELRRSHIASERIGPVFQYLEHESGSISAERLYREAIAKNPHRAVRGRASYWLARYLAEQAWYIRAVQRPPGYWTGRLEVDIDPSRYIRETYGMDALDRLSRSDYAAVMAEVSCMYESVVARYSDVENDSRIRGHRKSLGEAASVELGALRNLAIGQVAPEIIGEDVDGKPFKLSSLRGKVLVLDFGSHTYCSSCRNLVPHWQALTSRLKNQPFELIGINVDPDRSELKRALEKDGVTWRTVWDGDPGGPIFSSWDIRAWPTVIVIDQQGVIRFRNVFGIELDQAVDRLLGEHKAHGNDRLEVTHPGAK